MKTLSLIAMTALAAAALSGVAAAQSSCPNPLASPDNSATMTTTGAYQTSVANVPNAGGQTNITACPIYSTVLDSNGATVVSPGGRFTTDGFYATAPTLSINVQKSAGETLEFRAVGDCDPQLIVFTPRAEVYYDDDGGENFNSRVTLESAPSGFYAVWVGLLGRPNVPSDCEVDLVAVLSTPGGPDPNSCPFAFDGACDRPPTCAAGTDRFDCRGSRRGGGGGFGRGVAAACASLQSTYSSQTLAIAPAYTELSNCLSAIDSGRTCDRGTFDDAVSAAMGTRLAYQTLGCR